MKTPTIKFGNLIVRLAEDVVYIGYMKYRLKINDLEKIIEEHKGRYS